MSGMGQRMRESYGQYLRGELSLDELVEVTDREVALYEERRGAGATQSDQPRSAAQDQTLPEHR